MGLAEEQIMDILLKHSKLEYSSRGKNQYIPSNNYAAVVADIAAAINTAAKENNFHIVRPSVVGASVDRWRLLSPNLGKDVPVLIMDTTDQLSKEHVYRKAGMPVDQSIDLKSVNEELFKKLGEKLSAEMYYEKLLMDTICPDDEDQQPKEPVKPKQPPQDNFITGKKLGRKKPRKR
jgi:hypothetical protein